MRAVLKGSGISKEEATANPQAVLDVLAFHMDGGPPPKIPTKATMAKALEDSLIIQKTDYRGHFTGLKKLGQGASGVVYSATDKRNGRKVALTHSHKTHSHKTHSHTLTHKRHTHSSACQVIYAATCRGVSGALTMGQMSYLWASTYISIITETIQYVNDYMTYFLLTN
jgi:serine/threonine protein kinase